MVVFVKVCEDFLLRVNVVLYSFDSKMFIVILFICVFIGLVCFGVIVVNVLVFMGILCKFEFCNVYNMFILFFIVLDILKVFIFMLIFIVY